MAACSGTRVILFTILVIGGCFIPDMSYAQSEKIVEIDRVTARIDSVAEFYATQSPLSIMNGYAPDDLTMVFNPDSMMPELFEAEIELLETQKEINEEDLGFGFSTGYLENLEQGVFGAEGIFYQRRADLGLQWNILKNGLLENRENADQINSEIKLKQEKARIQSVRRSYQRLYNNLVNAFSITRSELLTDYHKILDEQQELTALLYEMKYISLNEVLNISSRKGALQAEAEAEKRFIKNLSEAVSDYPDPAAFPVMDINLNELLDDGLSFYRNIENPYRVNEFKPFNELSLSTFLRYNIYGGSGIQNTGQELQNREFFSVGLNISLPLPLSISKKRSVHEQEVKINEIALNEETDLIRQEVINQFRIYQSKLTAFRELYSIYVQQQETLRNQSLLRSIDSDSYSPARMLEAISQRYKTALELLEIKKTLYIDLIRIQTLLPDRSILKYLYPIDTEITGNALDIKYGTYIWSGSLGDHEIESINSFLSTEKVNTVYVSAGPEFTELDKVKEIRTSRPDLDLHLMIGDTELIKDDHRKELAGFIRSAAELNIKGIHLDVEPHTYEDWAARKNEYLADYVEMLKFAKPILDEAALELSVSVPVSYLPIINEIAALSDDVIIMAYNITDPERLHRSVEGLISEIGTESIVALRPEDFSSRTELKEFILKIGSEYGIRNIAIHDLGSWISLNNYNKQ